jgi:hypothetical protein
VEEFLINHILNLITYTWVGEYYYKNTQIGHHNRWIEAFLMVGKVIFFFINAICRWWIREERKHFYKIFWKTNLLIWCGVMAIHTKIKERWLNYAILLYLIYGSKYINNIKWNCTSSCAWTWLETQLTGHLKREHKMVSSVKIG